MRKARTEPGIRKVLVARGIRMDLAQLSATYLEALSAHQVGGPLKFAPDHTDRRARRPDRRRRRCAEPGESAEGGDPGAAGEGGRGTEGPPLPRGAEAGEEEGGQAGAEVGGEAGEEEGMSADPKVAAPFVVRRTS